MLSWPSAAPAKTLRELKADLTVFRQKTGGFPCKAMGNRLLSRRKRIVQKTGKSWGEIEYNNLTNSLF